MRWGWDYIDDRVDRDDKYDRDYRELWDEKCYRVLIVTKY